MQQNIQKSAPILMIIVSCITILFYYGTYNIYISDYQQWNAGLLFLFLCISIFASIFTIKMAQNASFNSGVLFWISTLVLVLFLIVNTILGVYWTYLFLISIIHFIHHGVLFTTSAVIETIISLVIPISTKPKKQLKKKK